MRRRFSRRRRTGGAESGTQIDGERAVAKILELGLVDSTDLELVEQEDVPNTYAVLARGTKSNGSPVLVSYAPRGADALMGVLGGALSLPGEGEEPFAGEAVAVAPMWTAPGLMRLGRIGELPFSLRSLCAPAIEDGSMDLEAGAWVPPIPLSSERVAAALTSADSRMLFERSASALEGLASKHDGAVRGTANAIELVILGRRVAELTATDPPVLETLLPQRSTAALSVDTLPAAFDRLEGQIRKRLNDRKVRDGEEGMRARSLPLLVQALQLRAVHRWPVGGADREVIDLVGIDETGRPVAAAVRDTLDLDGVGELIDVGLALQPVLGVLLADAEAPLRLSAPRLVVAAQNYTAAAARVLGALSLGHVLYEVRGGSRGLELAEVSASEAVERAAKKRGRRGGRGRSAGRGDDEERRDAESAEVPSDDGKEDAVAGAAETDEGKDDGERSSRRRGRRRGRRRSGSREDDASPSGNSGGEDAGGKPEASTPAPSREPLELSMFDLDEENEGGEGGRGRRRGRRRGGRGGSGGSGGGSGGTSDERGGNDADGPRASEPSVREDDEDEIDLDDALTLLAPDVPDFPTETREPQYDDEEDVGEEDSEGARRNIEREKRRMARKGTAEAPKEAPRRPRRRAAIVACADRDSVLAAVLLARDLRLVEGIWVYPQSDLMTFFRGAVTDLREETPIHVVGFTPSPAGQILQTLPLYASQLHWYDHQDWAPEDLSAMGALLPEGALHRTPGVGSSLPAVLSTTSRRSRFSDKLVDLRTGRFSQHDYERWGRLWWHKLGKVAEQVGDRRREIDPLLAGRPSDLAKDAARAPVPPIPDEVTWTSRRDFRLVHFAGFSMVVLEVEPPHDLHLAARIARERYEAPLSLAREGDGELFVLAADDSQGRGGLDLASMCEHLASKLVYVSVLADEDHVPRVRLEGINEHPERLDEIVSEIAMARSTFDA